MQVFVGDVLMMAKKSNIGGTFYLFFFDFSFLMTASVPFQVCEGVYGVLETVHVVPVDVPISQISIRVAFDVSNFLPHDLPRNLFVNRDPSLHHG